MALRYVQTPAVALLTGISTTATSITITPYPVDLDNVKLTMTDFGAIGYATIDPKISGYEEIISFTGITDNGDGSATLTGVVRSLGSKYPYTTTATGKIHGSSAVVVFSDNPQLFSSLYDYINTISIAGAPNATTLLQGLLELGTSAEVTAGTATGGTGAPLAVTPDALAASIYGTRLPSAAEKTYLTALTASMPGVISPYAGRSAPSTWFLCDGTAYSRTTYAALFAVICPSFTVTITIASPGVLTTSGSHGLVIGDRIHFTTTGGLPSGLAVNTDYYVISTGLTATQFQLALTPGGAAINTTGSQSGVHTFYISNFGKGDGSTTFNVPNMAGRFPIGLGATSNMLLPVEAANVNTGTDAFTIPNSNFPQQGQPVTLTTSNTLPAGLSLATTYYIIRVDSTHVKFATSQANANAATAIDLTTAGTGIHTITYALTGRQIIAEIGGEENHSQALTEVAAHTHSVTTHDTAGTRNGFLGASVNNVGSAAVDANTGGDGQHNNMPPFMVMNYIIKQ